MRLCKIPLYIFPLVSILAHFLCLCVSGTVKSSFLNLPPTVCLGKECLWMDTRMEVGVALIIIKLFPVLNIPLVPDEQLNPKKKIFEQIQVNN